METHEYAEMFPLATDAEVQDMANDIKDRGLLCPIITLDGKVLDGRNRLRACEIAGVAPFYEVYSGSDPLADVVSWNLKRRHLSTSQQAGIGADVANMRQGERTDLEPSAKLQKVSQASAAKMVGVSERLVADAVKVKNSAPELHEEVKAGRMTVNAAKQEVKQREDNDESERPKDPTDNMKKPHSDEVYTSETMVGLKRYWKKATKKERIEFKDWAKI